MRAYSFVRASGLEIISHKSPLIQVNLGAMPHLVFESLPILLPKLVSGLLLCSTPTGSARLAWKMRFEPCLQLTYIRVVLVILAFFGFQRPEMLAGVENEVTSTHRGLGSDLVFIF